MEHVAKLDPISALASSMLNAKFLAFSTPKTQPHQIFQISGTTVSF